MRWTGGKEWKEERGEGKERGEKGKSGEREEPPGFQNVNTPCRPSVGRIRCAHDRQTAVSPTDGLTVGRSALHQLLRRWWLGAASVDRRGDAEPLCVASHFIVQHKVCRKTKRRERCCPANATQRNKTVAIFRTTVTIRPDRYIGINSRTPKFSPCGVFCLFANVNCRPNSNYPIIFLLGRRHMLRYVENQRSDVE